MQRRCTFWFYYLVICPVMSSCVIYLLFVLIWYCNVMDSYICSKSWVSFKKFIIWLKFKVFFLSRMALMQIMPFPKNFILSWQNLGQSKSMCITVKGMWQTVHMVGSSFFKIKLWVILVCPKRILVNFISSSLFGKLLKDLWPIWVPMFLSL